MFFQNSGKYRFKKRIFSIFFFFIIIFTISLSSNAYALNQIHYTKNWIKNSEFSLSEDHWFTTTEGDISDVNATIYSEQGNLEICGENRVFSLIADPPLALNWTETDNPDFPARPDLDNITSAGCIVSHEFDDITAVQNPSVHWDQNITMPVDMSDYVIKSASIQAIVNATVDENLDRSGDYFARQNNYPNNILDTYSVGDYIRFYVLISDLEKNKVYEIAYFQTEQIGSGNPPGKDYLYDTYMLSVPQEVLIFYLESVLDTDNSNFIVSLGINIHIEDNLANYWDLDNFDELIIKFVNLTFTYEKKMDRYTSISFGQVGESINETSVEIRDANLELKIKIDKAWPKSLSPNSELKIFINNYEIENPIKELSDLNTTFQSVNLRSKDIKAYIMKNVNISISIMILLKDNFVLDQKITISIDDVYFTISYIVFMEDSSLFYIIGIILIILLLIIAILSILSLRSYILIPRKSRKRKALLSKTQKFKDAENIQGVLLIHNPSGLTIFAKNYSDLMEGKSPLFSGFLQAISIIGEEMTRKDQIKSKGVRSNLVDGIHRVIELDFNHFYCLVSDIEELRTVLILNKKASKRLKRQLLNFGLSVYAKFSAILKDWNHELDIFKEEIPNFLDNYFNLYYKLFYKIVITYSDLETVKKKFRLSRIDYKILTEILSISEKNNIFKLVSLLNTLSNKDEDLIIDRIEDLIQKNLLIPANSLEFQI